MQNTHLEIWALPRLQLHAVRQGICNAPVVARGVTYKGNVVLRTISVTLVVLRVILQKMCRDRKAKKIEIASTAVSCVQQDSEQQSEFYIQQLSSHKPLVVSVVVDGANIDMEVDTGALVQAFPWCQKPHLEDCGHTKPGKALQFG